MLEFQEPSRTQQHLLIEDSLGEVHGQNFSGILGITWMFRNLQHQKQTMRPIRMVSLRDLSTSPLYVFVMFYDPFLSSGSGWIVLLLQRPNVGSFLIHTGFSHVYPWQCRYVLERSSLRLIVCQPWAFAMPIQDFIQPSVFSSILDCCCHSSAWSYFKFCLRCRQLYPHDIYYLMLFIIIKYY